MHPPIDKSLLDLRASRGGIIAYNDPFPVAVLDGSLPVTLYFVYLGKCDEEST